MRRPERSPWALLLGATALAAACTEGGAPGRSAARAIVDGTPDAGDPAVVAIGTRRGGCGEHLVARCTGTLIAPRLVLTAAHCVLDPRLSSALEVLFGSAVDDPGATVQRVVHVAAHPDYQRDGDPADMAVLILDEDAPVAPLAVDPQGIDASLVGSRVRVVGFGQPLSTDPATGIKRTGTAVVAAVDDASFRIEADPAMTCHGDSGGPVLAERAGAEAIIGVTSRGDPGCSAYGDNVRVDRFHGGFLDAWIEDAATWPGPPAGSGEDLALVGDQLCAAPCTGDEDCPAGLACRPSPGEDGIVNRCMLPGLVAGTLGATCTNDDTCDDRCVRIHTGGPDACRCHRPCADAPADAPAPGGCHVAPGAPASRYETWAFLIGTGVLTLVSNVMRRRK